MAIAFRSGAANTYADRTNTTLNAPAGVQENDILICNFFAGANNQDPDDPVPPAGWSEFGTATDVALSTFQADMHCFWKRATSSEPSTYTFTHFTQNTIAWIGAFSGCKLTGTPLSATSTNTGTGTTTTGTGITTTAANSWLLWLENDFGDLTNNLSPPSGMTERVDMVIVYVASELRATAGATSNRSHTNNNVSGSPWAVRMVELLEEPAAGGGSTGTLSVTLGAKTLAATGKALASGTLNATLGAVTLAGTGKALAKGTLAVTLGDVTLSTTGKALAKGTLAATLGDVTLAGTGKAFANGTLAATLGNVTLAATGFVGDAPVSVGTLAVTLGAVTLAATGTVANQVFTGTLNATLGDVTLAATGKAFAKGTLAATLGDVTLAATGKALASGTLNATLGAVTLAGTGKIPNRGALAVTLGDVTLFARGRSRDSVEPPSSVCLDAWFTGAIQITAFVDDVPLDGLYQLEVTLPWQPISRCTQETANSSRSVSRQQVESPSILAASTSGFSLPGRRTIALR